MDDIELKPPDDGDSEFLRHLRQRTMVEHLERAGIFLDEAEHAARTFEGMSDAMLVICSGMRVGVLKCRETERWFEIRQLQILPEHQGKGLGTRLVRQVVDVAVSRNKAVKLSVLKENRARNLYERLGFQVVGEDEHEFHMQLVPAAVHSG